MKRQKALRGTTMTNTANADTKMDCNKNIFSPLPQEVIFGRGLVLSGRSFLQHQHLGNSRPLRHLLHNLPRIVVSFLLFVMMLV